MGRLSLAEAVLPEAIKTTALQTNAQIILIISVFPSTLI
jgi:hypothetical protein